LKPGDVVLKEARVAPAYNRKGQLSNPASAGRLLFRSVRTYRTAYVAPPIDRPGLKGGR
jgi:hypothetical protein